MRLTDLANPSRFVALTDRVLPWLAVATPGIGGRDAAGAESPAFVTAALQRCCRRRRW